jgi:hypothetical protein
MILVVSKVFLWLQIISVLTINIKYLINQLGAECHFTEITSMVTVFGLSIIELRAAIPVGFPFNLNPAVTIAKSYGGHT